MNSRSALQLALVLSLGMSMTGCASFRTSHAPTGNVIEERPAAVSVDAAADWAWSISGDGAIRPMQVFSLQGKTYLQMKPGQLIPAVLVSGEPVPFVIAAPYIVVTGRPERMDLLSSGYRAVVSHRGPVQVQPQPTVMPARVERIADATTAIPVPQPASTREVAHPATVAKATVEQAAPVDTSRVWRINPDQRLLSKALADWSEAAGVKLVWKSSIDVPIVGPAEYRDGDFLTAMSRVLADASGNGYRFFFSMSDRSTLTIVAIRS